mmetsp:Transcript_62198/g.110874  ORF Transcript_62198/g.110874 Transcript_62198/m.110874 type:complete len:230 (-) Transcript_62198:1325-2014(-)
MAPRASEDVSSPHRQTWSLQCALWPVRGPHFRMQVSSRMERWWTVLPMGHQMAHRPPPAMHRRAHLRRAGLLGEGVLQGKAAPGVQRVRRSQGTWDNTRPCHRAQTVQGLPPFVPMSGSGETSPAPRWKAQPLGPAIPCCTSTVTSTWWGGIPATSSTARRSSRFTAGTFIGIHGRSSWSLKAPHPLGSTTTQPRSRTGTFMYLEEVKGTRRNQPIWGNTPFTPTPGSS